jgi:hypothetical protein
LVEYFGSIAQSKAESEDSDSNKGGKVTQQHTLLHQLMNSLHSSHSMFDMNSNLDILMIFYSEHQFQGKTVDQSAKIDGKNST